MHDVVLYNIDDRGVATITIHRPDKRNALSSEVLDALLEALARADADARVRCVVLTGAGDKVFSAGGDLETFAAEAQTQPGLQGGKFVQLFERMGLLGIPIVGRINGHCLAGAFGVALACDMLVAVDDAEFGTPEILVGLWPMMIGALIYRNVPRKLANELIMTGRRLSAAEAAAAGIVNEVVPRAQLDAAVDKLTDTLVRHPRGIVRMGRQAVFQLTDMPLLEALRFLEGRLRDVLATDDAREGIQAFLEKRKPKFTGI